MKTQRRLPWIISVLIVLVVVLSCTNPIETELLKIIESKVDEYNESFDCALTISTNGGGTTFPAGTIGVTPGEAADISATPGAGCSFIRWSVESGSAIFADENAANTTVTLESGDAAIRAVFSASLTISAGNGGSVSPTGVLEDVMLGTATSISATPASGYSFINWTPTSGAPSFGDVNADSTTVTLTNGPAAVKANFTSEIYQLTVQSGGGGSVSPAGSLSVAHGVSKSILAVPDTGYHFTGWTVVSGSASIANTGSASTTVTLTAGDAAVQANFAINEYQLTVQNDGNGSTTPSGTLTVDHGSSTSIAAIPDTGFDFMGWSVVSGVASIANTGFANTTVSLISGNAIVKANFERKEYTLTIINSHCTTSPAIGSYRVEYGVPFSISLIGTEQGYSFRKWGTNRPYDVTFGDCEAANTTVTVTADDVTIVPNVAQGLHLIVDAYPNPQESYYFAGTTVTIATYMNISGELVFLRWEVRRGTATIASEYSNTTTAHLEEGDPILGIVEIKAVYGTPY